MKKILIGGIVGGLLIFIWQTLSWTVLQLHQPVQQYHPKQDSIMSFLNATINQEGGYLMPTLPQGSSMDDMNKFSEKVLHKPWAQIQYHKDYKVDMHTMYMNMLRGFLANIIIVCLLVWILNKMGKQSFLTTFFVTLFIGVITFTNEPYTTHIWYELFDIKAHLTDALASWGLCGLWLGWWLNRK
ncbi:MAG: hypothetical protein JSR09_03405 [Bacteroidetes bacterium]|nr:hypothetical protein [Bacteroidota bacterium]MBS1648729.1 hypothetical protein [Bacteroidota bacterium]